MSSMCGRAIRVAICALSATYPNGYANWYKAMLCLLSCCHCCLCYAVNKGYIISFSHLSCENKQTINDPILKSSAHIWTHTDI